MADRVNWCERQKGQQGHSMMLASRYDLGCAGLCGSEGYRNCTVPGCVTVYGEVPILAYEGSTLRALQDAGWTESGFEYGLYADVDQNACNTYGIDMSISYLFVSRTDWAQHGLCREGCQTILCCLTYDEDTCTCTSCDTANHFISDGNDYKNTDLSQYARNYLKFGGLTDAKIDEIINKLKK